MLHFKSRPGHGDLAVVLITFQNTGDKAELSFPEALLGFEDTRLCRLDRRIVLRHPASTNDRTGEQRPNASCPVANSEQHKTSGCSHAGTSFAANIGCYREAEAPPGAAAQ